MNDEVNYKNNPLHGLSLKNLLIELVDHYGFEILYAYLNINCFKTNPSIESSVKFLKKTEWARHKVEVLYLYEYKNLPRASSEQFILPPRDRIIPDHQIPGEPALLSLEDAERLREKREKKAEGHNKNSRKSNAKNTWSDSKKVTHSTKHTKKSTTDDSTWNAPTPSEKPNAASSDPWAKWK